MEMLHRRVRGAREPTARPTPQSASLLADAAAEYASNNRMPALRLFDAALACASSREEAAAAAWGAASVHASFGDVEPAQISLRAALDAGLDLDKALAVRPGDSTGLLVPFRGAPQITSQLKKFASAVAPPRARPPAPPPQPRRRGHRPRRPPVGGAGRPGRHRRVGGGHCCSGCRAGCRAPGPRRRPLSLRPALPGAGRRVRERESERERSV